MQSRSEATIFSIFLTFLLAVTPTEKQLSFANHLFEEGDYFRAITEYKRLMFMSSNPEEQLYANHRIFSSFKRAGRLEEAALYLDNFNDEQFKHTEKGKLQLLMHNTEQARQYLKLVNSDTVRILLGWSHMLDGDWEYSRQAFLSIPHNSDLSSTASRLDNYAREAQHIIPSKNPFISGFLSAILPGAGRFYTERPADGLFSFLTVAIPALASYFYWRDDRKRASAIAAGFAAAFYLGDVYGSVLSAHEYNNIQRLKYTDMVNNNLYINERYLK
jgi:TM2 domain-containing membrane protein YozV